MRNLKMKTKEELAPLYTNAVHRYLAETNKTWDMDKFKDIHPFEASVNSLKENLKVYGERIDDYKLKCKEVMSDEDRTMYKRAIATLETLWDNTINSSKEDYKKLYERDGNVFTTRCYIEIPLAELAKYLPEDAIFDNTSLVVMYYSDIATLRKHGSLLEKFKKSPVNKRHDMIVDDMEITHLMLSPTNNGSIGCPIMGKYKKDEPAVLSLDKYVEMLNTK